MDAAAFAAFIASIIATIALKQHEPTAKGRVVPKNLSKLEFDHNGVKVGIVGITGAVGLEILQVMERRSFKCKEIRLFASESSAGIKMESLYGPLEVYAFCLDDVIDLDVVFLAVSSDFALEYAPKIAEKGVLVIDNSSAFRYKQDIPLVVPEINIAVARGHKLIANPNCTTAIAAVVLWPIHQAYRIKKVIMSTYQAASGAGSLGMSELVDGIRDFCDKKELSNKIFPHPLPFNIIPQIDVFQDNGYTKEEMKVCWEMKKIMNDYSLEISCTAVRIPILRAHSEAITLETERPIVLEDLREILESTSGVKLVDDPSNLQYPMPISATGCFDVEVGRIRKNLIFGDFGIDLFISGDQLLRGAALNAVLIAEPLLFESSL